MSTRTLWIIFGLLVIAFAIIIVATSLFHVRPIRPIDIEKDAEPSDFQFEPEHIPGQEPSYQPLRRRTPNSYPPSSPRPKPPPVPVISGPPRTVVSYRGLIKEIGEDYLIFMPLVSGQEDVRIRASIGAETKIESRDFVGSPGNMKSIQEEISLGDLRVNDDIMLSGWAQGYYEPLDEVMSILKLL